VTPALLAHYRRIAAGRPGVLVVEATGVRDVPSGPLLRIGADRFVPGLRRLVEVIREASAGETRVLIQLIDFLRIRRRPSAEAYFGRFFTPTTSHRDAYLRATGASPPRDEEAFRRELAQSPPALWREVLSPRELEDLTFGARERVTDLHVPHVHDLPDTLPAIFAAAAIRARAAGFDGVEIHAAHAYTLASFLSATNTREDGHGGTREGRLRVPVAVLGAVRAACPPPFAVGVRFLVEEAIAGGYGLEDAVAFAHAFADAGADVLSLSKGGKFDDARQPKVGEAAYPYTGPSGHECIPTVRIGPPGPFGRHVALAGALRRALRSRGAGVPVVTSGGIISFTLAEAILARGDADFIGAARQTLADPDWWLKMRLGRGDEIRRCTLTNYCEALDQRHRAVTCKLWDHQDGVRRLEAPPWEP